MRRCLVLLTVLAVYFAWGVGSVFAQNAQIKGTIKDSSAAVLPGVTVTAQNAATGLQRTAVTDEQGNYQLPALPPGRYTVSTELVGFATQAHPDIVLVIEQTAVLNFTMKVAAVTETVTVTGLAPIVDVTRSEVTTHVLAEQMENLPVPQRRWTDLGMLVPGSSQDAVRNDHRNNVNLGASTQFYQTAYIVDGINNNWAEQGESRQNFPIDAIEEFKAATSNYKAELGLATGGALTVVTKSGTNTVRGLGYFFFRNQDLTARTFFQQVNPPYKRYQDGGTIGGPIIHNRTHYFVAYDRIDEDPFYTVATGGIWPAYEGTYKSAQNRWAFMAKVDHQLTHSQSVFLRYANDAEYRPIETVAGGVTPSASQDLALQRSGPLVEHTWVINDRAVNEFRFQYASSDYAVSFPYSHGKFNPGEFTEARLGLCAPQYLYPSLQVGGCGNSQMGLETRWEFKDDFSYLLRNWGGSHQWKMGYDYSYVPFAADGLSVIPGKGQWTFPKDAPYNANDPSTWPTQYTDRLPTYASVPSWYYLAYVQDDWSPGSRVVLNLGLRYDLQRGPFNEDLPAALQRVADKLGPGFGYPMAIPFQDGANHRGDHDNFGPRIGMAWDPTGKGHSSVHAAYGMFYDNLRSLAVPFNEITWPQAQQIVIRNPSFPDPYQGLSRDQFLSTAPPNISVLSNDLRSPYAHHFNVGLTQLLRKNLALTADATRIKRRGDTAVVDVNLPDPVTKLRPYPQFNRVSMTQSVLDTDYKALLVKIDKRLSDKYQFLVSYTLSKALDTVPSNLPGGAYGFQPVTGSSNDRRHRVVMSGTVQLLRDMQISGTADFRSSLPFNPTTSFDLNGDGYTGDLPPGVGYFSGCRSLDVGAINVFRTSRGLPAVSENAIACPGFSNVDLRFSKFFRFKGSNRLELITQLFNVFNRANFDRAVSNSNSALFGQVVQLPFALPAPSRQLELAVRYQF